MKSGYRFTSFVLIVTLALNISPVRMAYARSQFPYLAKEDRLQQARELLGSNYESSVVKKGEKFRHIESFIYKQVKNDLKIQFKGQARRVAKAIMQQSALYAFDPIFLLAVIKHESGFNPDTTGRFGEVGLMQIKPATALWVSEKYDLRFHGRRSLFDPVVNIKFGAAYLDYLRDKFSAHGRLYLAAYNMGVTNVHKALNNDTWPKEYPVKVMHEYLHIYEDLVKSRLHPASKGLFELASSDNGSPL